METNRRVTRTNEEVVEHEGPSPGGSWFQGLAKTWETMTAGPAEHATAEIADLNQHLAAMKESSATTEARISASEAELLHQARQLW